MQECKCLFAQARDAGVRESSSQDSRKINAPASHAERETGAMLTQPFEG
jgi:hypothetical protein